MESAEWSDKLSVGIKVIDEEHKTLLAIIRLLHVASASDDHPLSLRSVLQSLEDYVRTHFTVEEELMKAYEYPDRLAHVENHDSFRAKLRELRRALDEKEIVSLQSVLKYLEYWLVSHIQGRDKHLGEHLAAQGLR